jgi:predicted amidohydrolase
MKLALAQIQPIPDDVDQNISSHLDWIKKAKQKGADAIFFPELSLTGYEPRLAQELGFSVDDTRLDVFQLQSDNKQLTIGIGVPIAQGLDRYISMVIFQPNQPRIVYSKQLLHQDELPYFKPGKQDVQIDVKGAKIAIAICYESLQTSHLENALKKKPNIYLASVAKPMSGVDKAKSHFNQISAEYNLTVLMVNSVGTCDSFIAAGNSSIWSNKGECQNVLNNTEERLLIFTSNLE